MTRKRELFSPALDSTKRHLLALQVAFASTLLAACGAARQNPNFIDGQVRGVGASPVVVCQDSNGNGRCDPDESQVLRDASGGFRLHSVVSGKLIAEIRDPAGGEPVVLRAAPDQPALLSPFTTWLARQLERGVPRDEALGAMARRTGVSAADLAAPVPTRLDPISRDLLRRLNADLLTVVRSSMGVASRDVAMSRAMPVLDRDLLYAWVQFGSDVQPFSTSLISAVTVDGVPGALHASAPYPAGLAKAVHDTRYQIREPTVAEGRQVVRAITRSSSCPSMLVDGVVKPMRRRADPARGIDSNAASQTGDAGRPIKMDFDVQTCEAELAAGARVVSINGWRLGIVNPAEPLRRIVVVGDTGCRVQGPNAVGTGRGAPLQDCSEASAWPWPRIARAAASLQPDLIIHNGDIHYREGEPKGTEPGKSRRNEDVYAAYLKTITYGWAAWDADFFAPAGPLLASAPWAITRGNHELCDRAGAGWFRFLDYRRFPDAEPRYSPDYDEANCSNYIDPLTVRLGDLQLILMDVAGLADAPGKGKNQGWTNGDHVRTARQLDAVTALQSTQTATISWLVTHKPLLAFYAGRAGASTSWQFQKALNAGSDAFQAGNGHLPPNLQMVHSGHVHGWQMVSHPAATGLPTQFLIGNSGQALEGLFYSATSKRPFQPMAPRDEGHDIAPDDAAWPWHEVPWNFRLPSGAAAVPDAFSTSPIVDAGTPMARATEFGFALFERVGDSSDWIMTMYDPSRRAIRSCRTIGKSTRCDR